MSLVTRLLPDNPVLTKELRVRMRGSKAYWILLLYLGFLSLVMLLNYWSWQRNVADGNGGASEVSRLMTPHGRRPGTGWHMPVAATFTSQSRMERNPTSLPT